MSQDRLSPLDMSYLELGVMMVAVLVFEAGADGSEPPTFARLEQLLTDRIAGVAPLRRRLRKMPGNLAPAVLEEVPVDVSRHLFLWQGGNRIIASDVTDTTHLATADEVREPDLIEIAGRELTIAFDLELPPWRLLFVPSVERGRLAVIAACHHALADATGGLAILLAAILDLEAAPAPAAPSSPAPIARPQPSIELVRDAIAWHAARVVSELRGAPALARAAAGLLRPDGVDRAGRLASAVAKRRFRPTQRHPFASVPADGHRITAWESSLKDLSEVGHGFGATFNDVVLSALAGSIRSWHLHRRTEPDEVRCGFLVRLHGPDAVQDRNPTVRVFVDLPVLEDSPLKRMRLLAARTAAIKSGGEPKLVKDVERLAEHGPGRLARATVNFLYDNADANLLSVSNFPGVPFPVYMLGSPLRQLFPLVTMSGSYRLTLVVTSVIERAFMTCTVAEAIPEGELLGLELQAELTRLAESHRRLVAVRSVPLFASLTAERQDALATAAEELRFPAGATIYQPGSPPDYFYILTGGSVAARWDAHDMSFAAPDSFGAFALLAGEPRIATATAIDDVTVLRIHRDQFVPAISENTVAHRVADGLVAFVRDG